MLRFQSIFLILGCCGLLALVPAGVSGQYHPDTVLTKSNFQIQQPVATYRSFLLPGALFTYGILSLNWHPLGRLDKMVHGFTANTLNRSPFQVESFLQWSPAAAAVVLDIVGIRGRNIPVDQAVQYGLSLVIQAGVSAAVKSISKETRPNGEGKLAFPSGHTSNAFAAAEFLRLEYRTHHPWIAVGGYAVATAVAALRLYHNKHWFGDVVGGAAVGMAATDLVYILYPKGKSWLQRKGKNSTASVIPILQPGQLGLSGLVVF